MELTIASTWDGASVPDEAATVRATLDGDSLLVEVEAPYHGDPPPPQPPGRVDRLWEHEVVELFLLGDDKRYLEVELGPHGHYLVLLLHGPRRVERQAILIEYEAHIGDGRWHGRARLSGSLVPAGVHRGNAYAVRGVGDERRHYAAHPVPGERPDFHRLECFGAVSLGDGR